jgi:shikimate kinase
VGAIGRGRAAVLALGGGAFAEPANRELLMNNGITVWLDCPFDIVKRRVAQASHRPLARDAEKFAALYESRREVYGLADARIPSEGDDPAAAVEAILGHLLLR